MWVLDNETFIIYKIRNNKIRIHWEGNVNSFKIYMS